MNTNMFDDHDALLTAYALGELPPEAAAEFEKHIDGDASMRSAIDEIRQTAQMLRAEFAAEPSPGLTAQQREMLQGPLSPALRYNGHSRNGFRFQRMIFMVGGLAAAALFLLVAFVMPSQPTHDAGREQFAISTQEA